MATLLVVAITAYAALRQMRHMRSGNQVAALLPLIEQYRSEEIVRSQQYVLGQMQFDLEDEANRRGVMAIPTVGPTRAALPLLNFYESCGALVNAGVIDLELLLRYFTLPSEIWAIAEDSIALARLTRGDEVFENFEAMVALEQRFAARRGTSLYPKNLPRVSAKLHGSRPG
jgi:hypothetical protein